jgi:hypothetical protein
MRRKHVTTAPSSGPRPFAWPRRRASRADLSRLISGSPTKPSASGPFQKGERPQEVVAALTDSLRLIEEAAHDATVRLEGSLPASPKLP